MKKFGNVPLFKYKPSQVAGELPALVLHNFESGNFKKIIKVVNRILLVSLLWGIGISAYAQQPGVITGTISEAETGKSLPGVNIILAELKQGTSTKVDGTFLLSSVPAGTHTLKATFVGYSSVTRTITVSAGDTTHLNLQLSPKPIEMGEIRVAASRSERELSEIPQSIAVITAEEVSRQSDGVRLDDALNLVPGLRSFNRMGTDDSRYVLRGQGARNPWGINGVQVLVDGIPLGGLTGNTRVESFTANAIERIEVTRGPSNVWGGETIGGVINFITKRPKPGFHNEISMSGGSFEYSQFKGHFTGLNSDNIGYSVTVDRTDQEGFRDHNNWNSVKLNGNLNVPVLPAKDGELRLFVQVNRNDIEEPGAITKQQAAETPRMANNFEKEQDRGRLDSRGRFGASFEMKPSEKNHLDFAAFVTGRQIDHPLGFAYLDINSNQTYFRAKWDRKDIKHGFFSGNIQHNFLIGGDIQTENEETVQRENNGGVRGLEQANTGTFAWETGIFAQNHIKFNERLSVTLGARYDRLTIDVDDRFHSDDRDALETDFEELTVQTGMNYQVSDRQTVYATVGQAFEPPTAGQVEDARRFTGEELKPQKALNYEIGTRGVVPWGNRYFEFDLALYTMRIDDFINRVEVRENFSVTTNEEESRHNGIEAGLGIPITTKVTLNATYAYQDHTFNAGEHEGNQLPGVPRHLGSGELVWLHPAGLHNLELSGQLNITGKMYVNDEHTLTNDSFTTLDTRLNYELTTFEFGLRVNNMWDENYVPDIDINPQFGNDVFNPGRSRNVQATLTWKF